MSQASRTVMVRRELFIVIYLIYYTAVFDKEAYEVIQKLTDSLESMGTVLIYEPYKFPDINLDTPEITFQVFTPTRPEVSPCIQFVLSGWYFPKRPSFPCARLYMACSSDSLYVVNVCLFHCYDFLNLVAKVSQKISRTV